MYYLSKAKKKRLIDEVEAAYKPHTTIKTNLKQHQDVLYYENGTNVYILFICVKTLKYEY